MVFRERVETTVLILLISLVGVALLLKVFHKSVLVFAMASIPEQMKQNTQEGKTQLYFFSVVFGDHQPPIWEYMGLEGNVTDLIFDPDEIGHAYASVYLGGFFETYDSGHSWVKHEQITLTTRINDIEIHPVTHTTLFLGTWAGYGVYLREPGSNLWKPVTGWHYLYPTIYSISVHPVSSTIMFAGSGNWEAVGGEIYKTNDSGETWVPVSPMFTNALTFAFDPMSPMVVYAGTQFRGVYKSIDGGNSWYPNNNGLPITVTNGANGITSLVIHPEDSQWLYAATSGGVYVSYDGGGHWSALFGNIDANAVLFHPDDPTTMYLGANGRIFVSDNAGLNWFQLGQCGIDVEVNRLAVNPFDHNKLWVATNNGLWQCKTDFLGRRSE